MSNESPHSFTTKAYNPDGYDCMFTVRSDDATEFFTKVKALLDWLPRHGFEPTRTRPNSNGNGAPPPTTDAPAAQNGNVPVCQYHGEMKPSKFGGWYCSAKMADGSYCQEKAD